MRKLLYLAVAGAALCSAHAAQAAPTMSVAAPAAMTTEAGQTQAGVQKIYWVWHGRRWNRRRWAPRVYYGGRWVPGHYTYY